MGNTINLNGSKGIKYKLNGEVATGDTWVDGNPIYSFVKKIQLNGNTKFNIDFKYKDIVSYNVIFKGKDVGMGNKPFIGIPYSMKDTDQARSYVVGNECHIRVGQEFITFTEALITFNYTKSGGG